MVVLNIFMDCLPDKVDELFSNLQKNDPKQLRNEGNLFFKAYRNGNEIALIEHWETEEALHAHSNTDEAKARNQNLAKFFTKPSVIKKYID